jgi:hypothetical protein
MHFPIATAHRASHPFSCSPVPLFALSPSIGYTEAA